MCIFGWSKLAGVQGPEPDPDVGVGVVVWSLRQKLSSLDEGLGTKYDDQVLLNVGIGNCVIVLIAYSVLSSHKSTKALGAAYWFTGPFIPCTLHPERP